MSAATQPPAGRAFEAQARRTPDAPAVEAEGTPLSPSPEVSFNYLGQLDALLPRAALSPEAAVYTPSDFPEAELSQDELDDLVADFISLND